MLLFSFPSTSWCGRQATNSMSWYVLEWNMLNSTVHTFFWTTQIFLKVNTGGPHLYLSLKLAANILTLCSLARSSSITSHVVLALSSLILLMAACVLLRFRHANTTVQPCNARERAVSYPVQKQNSSCVWVIHITAGNRNVYSDIYIGYSCTMKVYDT